jgi:hypothetical protein
MAASGLEVGGGGFGMCGEVGDKTVLTTTIAEIDPLAEINRRR